jgi:hypothetical protein
MFLPTAIATQLAADSVERRRGAATHRLTFPNPFAGIARARMARRPAPCVAC